MGETDGPIRKDVQRAVERLDMCTLIELVEYDQGWPARFQRESATIMEVLGPACVSTHHVGSTAVPGLAAKPIVDIAIEVADYPPSSDVIVALAELGYECMGESGVAGRHWFRKGNPRWFHLHATPVVGHVVRAQVAFRDYLREDSRRAAAYLEIKRRAAKNRTIDSAEYAAAKTDFIQRALDSNPSR